MSETETKTEKAPKAKAPTASNGNGLTADENEMAQALALFRSIPKTERNEYLIDAQMSHLGRQAFAFLADGYAKLHNGEKLSSIILLDGETGCFCDPDDVTDDGDEDEEEDGEEDEDAIDATEGEDDGDEGEDEEPEYTATQAVRMLRKWMREKDYSQAFVAKKLKVTQPAISTWMNKTSLPREVSIERIVRLCSK